MFRNIIVALDGSETAEQALPIAAGLARRAGASLRLMHALDYLHTDYAHCTESREPWSENTYDLASRYLQQMAALVLDRWHMHAETTLIEADAVSVLSRSAEAKQADLTVMTTHGRGPIDRFWLGSVTDQVIREAGHPVLIVPPAREGEVVRDDRPFTHMLIPLDGSDASERVLHYAAHLTSGDGVQISLVRVMHTPLVHAAHYEISDADDEMAAHRYLLQQSHALSWTAHEVKCAALADITPIAAQILDYAETYAVDVIALSTHGHGGVRRLLLGSVADKVIRSARVPVLVVRNGRI